MTSTPTIELKPRHRPMNVSYDPGGVIRGDQPRHRPMNVSYDPGGVIRGDREVWISGAHWLNAITSHHGTHGSSHHLEYADGGELVDPASMGRHNQVVKISSFKTRCRHAPHTDRAAVPKQYDAIVAKVRELYDAGKLEDPATRKANREESNRICREQRDAETAERTRMLEGVFSLRDRTDLTQQERDGLAYLYKEAFAAPMPFPEGKPQ